MGGGLRLLALRNIAGDRHEAGQLFPFAPHRPDIHQKPVFFTAQVERVIKAMHLARRPHFFHNRGEALRKGRRQQLLIGAPQQFLRHKLLAAGSLVELGYITLQVEHKYQVVERRQQRVQPGGAVDILLRPFQDHQPACRRAVAVAQRRALHAHPANAARPVDRRTGVKALSPLRPIVSQRGEQVLDLPPFVQAAGDAEALRSLVSPNNAAAPVHDQGRRLQRCQQCLAVDYAGAYLFSWPHMLLELGGESDGPVQQIIRVHVI